MADEHDHEAIIRGLREGRQDAWDALYTWYSGRIWRYIARLVGPDNASVGDIHQETFVAAAKTAHGFNPSRGTVWNWLSGIAHHQLLAHWRRNERATRLHSLCKSGDLPVDFRVLDEESPDSISQRSELVAFVRSTLAAMPHDYAALLMSKYLDENSLEEMSVEFGMSLEAVRSKLARARRDFRSRFGVLDSD